MIGEPDDAPAEAIDDLAAGLRRITLDLLRDRGWSAWSVTTNTESSHLPVGGVSLRFDHPLSRGMDFVLLPSHLDQAGRLTSRFIDSNSEFPVVASAQGAVSEEHASLLRRLRYCAEVEDPRDAVERAGWALFELGLLTEPEARWLAQAVQDAAQHEPPWIRRRL
jgi:hypothetical protein